MKNIWAPWRIKYILSNKTSACVFCIQKSKNYKHKHYILYESTCCLVLLNNFPYSTGHLMVIPKRHLKDLNGLSKNEFLEFFELVRYSTNALKAAIKPEGFNLGINLGKAAGAGHESHLHFHIVARWQGDHNFMPVIGQTKVISEYLNSTYKKLLPYFNNCTI